MNVPSDTVPVNLTGKTLLKITYATSIWLFKLFNGDGTIEQHFHLRYNNPKDSDTQLLKYAKELGLDFFAYRITRPKKDGVKNGQHS
jgi:hypothetical protein